MKNTFDSSDRMPVHAAFSGVGVGPDLLSSAINPMATLPIASYSPTLEGKPYGYDGMLPPSNLDPNTDYWHNLDGGEGGAGSGSLDILTANRGVK